MQTCKIGNKHAGRQVKRFRESIGMKQDILAKELNTTQQSISYYEKQEELDEDVFAQLASGMGISPEVLRDFTSAATFSVQETKENLQNIEMKDNLQATYNFNPIDKIIEQTQKIEDLYTELLKSERDKVAVLSNANKALQDLTEMLVNTGVKE